jgi:hypothetical protein
MPDLTTIALEDARNLLRSWLETQSPPYSFLALDTMAFLGSTDNDLAQYKGPIDRKPIELADRDRS